MSKNPPYNPKNEKEELLRIFREVSSDDPDFDRIAEDNSGPEDITVTESETEQALTSVKDKLSFESDAASANKQAKENGRSMAKQYVRYYLAAAVILVSIGIGYLLMPVTKTVPYGETASVQLPDGSIVTMNSGTEMTYSRLFGVTNRHIQFNGEAYFEVESSEQAFIVEVNEANVEVTGTEFNLRSWRGDPGSPTVVTVATGTVQFYTASNTSERVELNRGFTSSWHTGDYKPDDPVKVDLKDVIAWKENNLSFIGQPLRLIFNELERKFDVNIEIQDERTVNEVLTTFYSGPQNVELLLDDITTVKGLQYRETADGYVVFNENRNR